MEKNIGHYANFYLMCDCVNSDFPEDHIEYDKGWQLVGIDWTNPKPFLIENESDYTWAKSVKPKLRKLESMTLPEAVSLFDLIGKGPSISDQAKAHQVRDFICTSKFYNGTTNLSGSEWVKIINWLRSKGFDCDGLIDARCAIEKQPTTQNQGV